VHPVSRAARAASLVWRRQTRQQLPAVLPGDVCRPPDFVGVGVQRAGSTWWDELVAAHPGVDRRPDRMKEVHYFDFLYDTANGRRPDHPYARFFPRPEGVVAGEWTPRYLYDGWALPLLREAAPDAKILVILRDPVERYSSSLTLQRQWGLGFNRNFLQHTFQRGLYASQLDRLFDLYPREQVLVLQFERCLRSLDQELARTYEFLGLEPGFVPADAREARSKSEIDKVELSQEHRRWLRDSYRADVDRLSTMLPELDRTLWRNFAG
jgi:hypothetical protein